MGGEVFGVIAPPQESSTLVICRGIFISPEANYHQCRPLQGGRERAPLAKPLFPLATVSPRSDVMSSLWIGNPGPRCAVEPLSQRRNNTGKSQDAGGRFSSPQCCPLPTPS